MPGTPASSRELTSFIISESPPPTRSNGKLGVRGRPARRGSIFEPVPDSPRTPTILLDQHIPEAHAPAPNPSPLRLKSHTLDVDSPMAHIDTTHASQLSSTSSGKPQAAVQTGYSPNQSMNSIHNQEKFHMRAARHASQMAAFITRPLVKRIVCSLQMVIGLVCIGFLIPGFRTDRIPCLITLIVFEGSNLSLILKSSSEQLIEAITLSTKQKEMVVSMSHLASVHDGRCLPVWHCDKRIRWHTIL